MKMILKIKKIDGKKNFNQLAQWHKNCSAK